MIKTQMIYGTEHYYFPWPDMTELLNDVKGWCDKNCTGNWNLDIGGYTFEREEDATWFLLR